MDKRELVMLMLDYEEKYRELEELEKEIKAQVMVQKETVGAGNVEAKYKKGRKTYLYQDIIREWIEQGIISEEAAEAAEEENTKVRTSRSVSWAGIAKTLNIDKDDIPYEEGDAYVKIKVN